MSTLIMDNIHWFGLSGWRWMFILEGIPAVLLGVVTWFVMTERPADAAWLADDERSWLADELAREAAAKQDRVQHLSIWKTLANPKVLYLSVIYFVYQVGSLGTGYWLPQIIRSLGRSLTTVQIGLIGMIPYVVATIAMIAWARHSDLKRERRAHCWIPLAVSALAMFAAAMTRQPVLAIAAISIALAGLYSFKSPFWAVPGLFLTSSSATTAVAAINSIGNLGGFVGPYAQGIIVGQFHTPLAGLLFFGMLLVIATIMMATIRLRRPDPDAPKPEPVEPAASGSTN